ncbi:uncharacterized protein LOC143287958 [Babylonia areolata]|uniref:uncharacterized protein LOC143287958 n=1 Tax=Babylonia areolata TaxID=304850 RepID=UPI003FCFD8B6
MPGAVFKGGCLTMKKSVKQAFSVVLVSVFILVGSTARAQIENCRDYPPCSTVPDRLVFFYPNWEDCSTYWRCSNNRPTKLSCPRGQVFDFFTLTCRSRLPLETVKGQQPILSCDLFLHGD